MPESVTRFSHFAAIDWSGALGERHHGIAVAICGLGEDAPRLVHPRRKWSRGEALHWIAREMPPGTLVGLDLGMSLPFMDKGAFFPGWGESPATARELWALIDRLCTDDDHLAAAHFLAHPEARHHFRHRGDEGAHFGGGRGRFRVTEEAQRKIGCNPYSNFNLVGAAQVGKSSLTGMRVLNRLSGYLPVWPLEPLPESGSAVIEIYTSIAAIAAGRRKGQTKLRTYAELNVALAKLASAPVKGKGAIDDHRSDALLTAAWLRQVADREEYWNPRGMSREIAATEGWTFGAL